MIFDTLYFNTSKIKVFNTSLYYSINRFDAYSQNYDGDSHLNKDLTRHWWSMNKNHDLITNFRIIKNLYMNNKILLDYNLIKIIDLDEFKYLTKIESIYS